MRELDQFAYENHIPLYVTLEITLKCNLRCVHCYNFDRSAPKQASGPELTPARILRAIDEIADEGALFLSITGGEAMAHPHLFEFIRHARRRQLAVRLKTNATLITLEKAKALRNVGVTDVDISLYGACAKTHDAFTAKPGSFEKTTRGIRAAVEAGMTATVSLILHRGNPGELVQMIDLCESLGATTQISTELTARYDGNDNSLDVRLTEAQLRELYMGETRHLFEGMENPDGGVQCPCARNLCGISSSGEVYPCIGSPVPSGNLLKQSFREIWRQSPVLNRIRGLTLKDFKKCEPCADRVFCQRSSGSVYVNTGNYTGADPWTCMQAGVVRDSLGLAGRARSDGLAATGTGAIANGGKRVENLLGAD